jgi:hypothetical protein
MFAIADKLAHSNMKYSEQVTALNRKFPKEKSKTCGYFVWATRRLIKKSKSADGLNGQWFAYFKEPTKKIVSVIAQ